MSENLAAEANITIKGSVSQVWDALVNPEKSGSTCSAPP